MGKELSGLSLEELWTLFPIRLTEHSRDWGDDYAEQETKLANILKDYQVERISHIGSTAVGQIWAKPIVDILVEIAPDEELEQVAKAVERQGYIRMSADQTRISLNFGYTPDGFAEKVYHLHLRYAGDHNELYFRDYMKEHPQTAKAYERLKLRLWKQYEHDRDGYTQAKTDFIVEYTKKAKELYQGRYE